MGMVTMSPLIATHQKVDTTVSSGLPGVLVREGVCLWLCVHECLCVRRRDGQFYLCSVGMRIDVYTFCCLPNSHLSHPFSKLNVTWTAEKAERERGQARRSSPPALQGGRRDAPGQEAQGGRGGGGAGSAWPDHSLVGTCRRGGLNYGDVSNKSEE